MRFLSGFSKVGFVEICMNGDQAFEVKFIFLKSENIHIFKIGSIDVILPVSGTVFIINFYGNPLQYTQPRTELGRPMQEIGN